MKGILREASDLVREDHNPRSLKRYRLNGNSDDYN